MMTTERRGLSSVAAVAVLFLIASFKDGVMGAYVDISPRSPTVKVGQNFTFMCKLSTPLMYCRIEVPGISKTALNLNENSKRTSNYWYEGDGLSSGQCGITVARVKDDNNGQIKCSMGIAGEDNESVGVTNLTVARPPQNLPELLVYPEPEPRIQAYSEDAPINAMCTVRDSRPVATISWYIGEEQISDGVGPREIVDMPKDLYTVRQNLTRRLSWKDNGKDLRCVAKHIALDGETKQTIKQINVRFPPRPIDRPIEQFGYVIGDEGLVIVHIQANPKPELTWVIGGEPVREGNLDTTQRFEATPARSMGNGTWEVQLRIIRVSGEDVDRTYQLRARNELGEQTYRVVISTSAEPQGSIALGTGPIIGIVVAVLVLLIIIFMLIFARATGRWCFSGGVPIRHDNKESSDTESADHGPTVKRKKPKMNLTYILKKKKDKVAADADDLKLQSVAMETDKEMEKPGTESSEHIATPPKGKAHGQDVVYAELDLQATRRPIVRKEDDKTEYAEIIHTKPGEEGGGTQ